MPDSPEFKLDDAVAILTRTPATLMALLTGMPAIWLHGTEGQNTWSPAEILGHLVVAERADWMPRIRILLESGESRPFDPFDRFAHLHQHRDKPLDQLLEEFASLRRDNLAALGALHLQPTDLPRTGTHPAFGTVTLSQLLATWAVHDLTHLHQLSRVLAHQYRSLVGPWSAYLGVLQCTGHSTP